MTFTGIPSDSRSTLTNEEWRINSQLRLGLPLASYHNLPHEPCPHGCTHPQTKERVKVRYGYHLVTDCRRANQGNKSHKDVETTLIHHLNTPHEHHGDQGQALLELALSAATELQRAAPPRRPSRAARTARTARAEAALADPLRGAAAPAAALALCCCIVRRYPLSGENSKRSQPYNRDETCPASTTPPARQRVTLLCFRARDSR